MKSNRKKEDNEFILFIKKKIKEIEITSFRDNFLFSFPKINYIILKKYITKN